MAKYLLLRNNKESGPYILDDLVNLGIKPYDLVWIEGKSAAWRYPSEINELKPYAPIEEEQPFDRFYKKASEERKEELVNPREHSSDAPVVQKEELKFVPKKSVFVTLPGQKAPVQKTKTIETPALDTTPKQPQAPPAITISETPEVAEIKYSQPLDEIKEMYVKTLQQRKSKKIRKTVLLANLKKAAVILGLVCVGVLAGFLIKSKPAKADDISRQMMQSPPTTAVTNTIAKDDLKKTAQQNDLILTEQPKDNNQTEEQDLSKYSDRPSNDNQQLTTVRIRKETMIRPMEKKEEFNDEQIAPGTETDALTGERNRKIRSGDTNADDNPVLKTGKNKLNDLVSVSSNDYKQVAFGGIRNLQLTVTNNSKFELDHVIVELQYLRPSEETLRTENIRFQSIPPHTSATIKVPDTNRGIKVLYRIINIESKQNDDTVAGM